jgi:hypothetical protein
MPCQFLHPTPVLTQRDGLTYTLRPRVMQDEISVLQRLPRYLSVECLHGWNTGQCVIFLHESIYI